MDVPETPMSLPGRQQVVLDQIERILAAADPQLKSMFAAFTRFTSHEAVPETEVISHRTARRWAVMISIMVVGVLSMTMLFVVSTSRACPGLSSDQVVASAAVRFAGCSKATNSWSKGGR
jgi:nicotinamide riboside transporter PnuC